MNNTITTIILALNEERCIRRAIYSAMNISDEVIVIDTGSTDNTIKIVNSIPSGKVKLLHHDWCESFSEIRNFGIDNATSQWCFFLDADEVIVNGAELKIQSFLDTLNCRKDVLDICLCPNIVNENGSLVEENPRIFRVDSNIRYYGRVHECLDRKNGNKHIKSLKSHITVFHDGYRTFLSHSKNKKERNKHLLQKQIKEDPKNIRWKFFNLIYENNNSNHYMELLKEIITFNEDRNFIPFIMYYYPHSLYTYSIEAKKRRQYIKYLLSSFLIHEFEKGYDFLSRRWILNYFRKHL